MTMNGGVEESTSWNESGLKGNKSIKGIKKVPQVSKSHDDADEGRGRGGGQEEG